MDNFNSNSRCVRLLCGLESAGLVMRAAILAVFAVWAGLAAVRIHQLNTSRVAPAAGGKPVSAKLLFADDFNTFDSSKWDTCYTWPAELNRDNCTNAPNHEMQLYNANNVSASGGVLSLTAKPETTTDRFGTQYPYTSGMISSYGHFQYKYGYYEIRTKVPAGKGLWPAAWTLPTDLTWPPEIDVFEILGDQPRKDYMTVHFYNSAGQYDSAGGMYQAATGFDGGYHTFAVDWQPTSIRWYVDGKLKNTYNNAQYIPNKPMYLLANLAVGGDWPGAPDATTPFPSTMLVDYIKVWDRKP